MSLFRNSDYTRKKEPNKKTSKRRGNKKNGWI